MTDPYNTALRYLKNKYGVHRLYLTYRNKEKLRKANKSEQKNIETNFTDDDYICTYYSNNISDEDDKYIGLLLKQYNYGISVKKELETVLKNRNII